MGKIYTSQAYGHLHVPIPLHQLENRITLLTALNERFQIITIPTKLQKNTDLRKRLKFMKSYIKHVTLDIVTRYQEAIKPYNMTLPTQQQSRRVRRQFVIAGAAIAGLISGAISAKFTKSTNEKIIEKSQDVIAHTVEQNLVRTATNSKDIQTLNRTVLMIEEEFKKEFMGRERLDFETAILRATLVTSLVHEELNLLVKIIIAAQKKLLDPEAMDAEVLHQALQDLNALAVKHGYESSAQTNQDVANMETSTLVDPQKKIIHLINHIPFFRPGQGMTLYHFYDGVSKTNMVDSQGRPLFLEVDPPQRFLALSQDGTTSMELKEDELQGCHRKGTDYYCSYLARDKRGKPNCLLALHDRSVPDIKNHCRVSLTNHASRAERVTNDLIFLTETDPMEITIDCPDQQTNRSQIQGSRLIHLNPGCILNTRNQVITRPRHEADVVVEGLFKQFVVPPSLWIYEEERDEIQEIAKQLMTIGKSVPLDQIKALAQFRKELKDARSSWGSFDLGGWILHAFLPSIGTGIIFLFVLSLFWKCGPILWQRLCLKGQRYQMGSKEQHYHDNDFVDDVADHHSGEMATFPGGN